MIKMANIGSNTYKCDVDETFSITLTPTIANSVLIRQKWDGESPKDAPPIITKQFTNSQMRVVFTFGFHVQADCSVIIKDKNGIVIDTKTATDTGSPTTKTLTFIV
jgi:hypothetical protein